MLKRLLGFIPGFGPVIEAALDAWEWIWSHKALAALIGISIFAAVQTSRLATRTIERDAAQTKIESYQREAADADTRAADTAATAATYLDAYNQMKASAEALAAQQAKQQAAYDTAVHTLAAAKDAAEARASTFKSELERKANEPGATAASVGRAALAGLR